MRIGIVTFWTSKDNYGQFLQYFALQSYLLSIGHSPFLIRYKSHKVPIIHQIKSFIKKNLFLKRNQSINKRAFDCFRNNYFHKSKTYYGIDEITKNPPAADLYIAGSDQIWSMPLSDPNNTYFYLSFIKDKNKKISYAASFGTHEYNDIQHLYLLKSLLSNFKAISVREKDGIEICNKIDINCQHVLDPTLLIPASEYFNKFKCKKSKDRFIYIYHLNILNPSDIYWKELQHHLPNLPLYATCSSGRTPAKEILHGVIYKYPNPKQWIEYISSAELVVTTSFHGVVFSILFHKHFIVFPLKGECSNSNNRVIDLLENVGLTKLIAHDENDIEPILKEVIDWRIVDEKLSFLKDKSIQFLQKNIS